MRGGDGKDTCIGGAGHDQLYAGLNDGDVDTFKFAADALGEVDYIYEFEAGVDKFQLDTLTGTGEVTLLKGSGSNVTAYVTGVIQRQPCRERDALVRRLQRVECRDPVGLRIRLI